jgi:hypothetical protein
MKEVVMEKIQLNYHLKLQEMCDCYMETDYLAKMQDMVGAESNDIEEDAVKYMALAILYAITRKAEKLSLKKKGDELSVRIKVNNKEDLPQPSAAVVDKVFQIMREILHIDEDKGEMDLSLGLRTGEVNVHVKVKGQGDKQSLKVKFPTL